MPDIVSSTVYCHNTHDSCFRWRNQDRSVSIVTQLAHRTSSVQSWNHSSSPLCPELWKQVDIRSGWSRERSHLEDSDCKVLEYQVEASGFIPGIKLLESLDQGRMIRTAHLRQMFWELQDLVKLEGSGRHNFGRDKGLVRKRDR